MIIENRFEVPISAEQAWPLLTDVAAIASCIPGATIVGVDEEGRYRGQLSVKLGPVGMTFEGTLRFIECDQGRAMARVAGEAREVRNRGSANAIIDFHLKEVAQHTCVEVTTDLSLSGQAAQYGRAKGAIETIATFLFARFARCLSERLNPANASS